MANTLELTDDGAPRKKEGPDPMIGRRLLHYRVLEVVGQGGMSVVYRGRDENLDRDVAIKVLHPFLARKEECRARLAREARAVARLEHPNILKVFDFSGDPSTVNERLGARDDDDDDDKDGFLVCEFVPGETLKHFADRHALWSVPEVGAMVVLRVARALQHAHEQGVVHRDMKPENIMVRDDGVLKLMDFGIAQVVDQKQLTVTGTLLGSPAHMAPESIEGYPADARSDIFSLGTVLYWLVTGALPFEALTPHALLKTIVDAAPMPPQQRAPRVSDEIARVITRAMARKPDERYASSGDMAGALEDLLGAAGLPTDDLGVAEVLKDPREGLARTSTDVRRAFLARAERLLEEGSAARALSSLGRVLAEHPGDTDAEALLEQAQAGAAEETAAEASAAETAAIPLEAPPEPARSIGRAMLAAALVVVIGVVAFVGTLVDKTLPPDPATDPVAPPSLATATKTGAAVDEGDEALGQETRGDSEPPEEPSPLRVAPRPVVAKRPHPEIEKVLPPLAQPARTLRVVVSPYAHIFVDGREVARNVMARDIQLTPGKHELRFEHEHAKTKVREIDVPADGVLPEVRVALDEAKPALLRVEAVPPSADVGVDGVPKGKAGESVTTPIVVPFKRMVARARFEVVVYKEGFKPHVVTPELEAGQTRVLKVVLEPERDVGGDGPRKPIEPGDSP